MKGVVSEKIIIPWIVQTPSFDCDCLEETTSVTNNLETERDQSEEILSIENKRDIFLRSEEISSIENERNFLEEF